MTRKSDSDSAAQRALRIAELLFGRVLDGYSNKEIAEKLSLSEGTVRNNLSAALTKLNLRDRTQLAIWAVQTGLAGGSDEA